MTTVGGREEEEDLLSIEPMRRSSERYRLVVENAVSSLEVEDVA